MRRPLTKPSAAPPRGAAVAPWFVLALGLAAAAGCGEAPPEVAPVAGVVLLDGEPAAGIEVRFLPVRDEGEPPRAISSGITDDAGRFELVYRDTDDRRDGAAVGPHKVLLRDWAAEEARDPSVAPERIGPAYTSAARTPLQVTVAPAGDGPGTPQEVTLDARARTFGDR